MAENLSEQLANYRADWRARVPADKQTLMDQHVAHLAATGIDRAAKQVGDRAPAIRLRDQHGETFDVATLLAKGLVVVTFYRGGLGLSWISRRRTARRTIGRCHCRRYM